MRMLRYVRVRFKRVDHSIIFCLLFHKNNHGPSVHFYGVNQLDMETFVFCVEKGSIRPEKALDRSNYAKYNQRRRLSGRLIPEVQAKV